MHIVAKRYKFIYVLITFWVYVWFCNRSVRIQFTAETDFVRSLEDGDTSQIRAYFHTPSFIVTEGQPPVIRLIVEAFNNLAENFVRRGSGYVLNRITKLTMRSVKYRPLGVGGSSYISTPPWLQKSTASSTFAIRPETSDASFGQSCRRCIPQIVMQTDSPNIYLINIALTSKASIFR